MATPIYWHMQMHPTGEIEFARDHLHYLLEHRKIIGMGDWADGWTNNTIPEFKDVMKVNDIVAMKIGAQLIALVQVIGGCYKIDEKGSDFDWIEFRRPIRVLDWEIEDKTLPHTMGTLNRCVNDVETTRIIKIWHERVVMSLNRRGICLSV